jgi:F0F1-type ATP synthase membrane subunit a
MKIISPAYILPNKRNECDTGFATRETNSKKKLAGINKTLRKRFLDILIVLLQAFIFMTLVIVYMDMAHDKGH